MYVEVWLSEQFGEIVRNFRTLYVWFHVAERDQKCQIKPYIVRRRKCMTRKIHKFCQNLTRVKLEGKMWTYHLITTLHNMPCVDCNKNCKLFLYFSIALKKWQTPKFQTHHCWWAPQHIRTYKSNCHPWEAWSVL